MPQAKNAHLASSENYADLKREFLETRPGFRKAWEESHPKRMIAMALVRLRKSMQLTQKDVADRAGWDKAFVSRLESASLRAGVPDTLTIQRYAEACGGVAGLVFATTDSNGVHILDAISLTDRPGYPRALEYLRDRNIGISSEEGAGADAA
jgi:transcriptional regulator with XRE-family HTH domain